MKKLGIDVIDGVDKISNLLSATFQSEMGSVVMKHYRLYKIRRILNRLNIL